MTHSANRVVMFTCASLIGFCVSAAAVAGQELRDDANRSNVAEGVTCDSDGPCIVESTAQPLRVLPRSFSAILAEPSEDAAIRTDSVRAFMPAYVFDRVDLDFSDPVNPTGWYHVGYSTRAPIGWMRARDAVEWRTALTLAYTHKGFGTNQRSPVVMFDDRERLQSLVTSGDRNAQAQSLISQIRQGESPDGVIARESDQYLDIDETFYLLPVIQWEREEAFDETSHYLQVYAAVPGDRSVDGEDTLLNPVTRARGGNNSDGAPTGPLQVDVKFVLDMTGSMQPYIDEVTAGIALAVQNIAELAQGDEVVRFGLIGYRDNLGPTPELEFTSRNFTPDLVSAGALRDLLYNDGRPLAAQVTSDEWAEDVFSGVSEAIRTGWSSDNSVRLIVLLGDASGHEPGITSRGSKSTTNLDSATLREQLRAANVYVVAMHLRDQAAEADWPMAAQQFRALASNTSGEEAAYYAPLVSDTASIQATIARLPDIIEGQMLAPAREGDFDSLRDYSQSDEVTQTRLDLPPGAETAEEGAAAVERALRAALVDYLGDGAAPQKDFIAWVHDFDLADPSRAALETRVIVNRDQLDTVLRRTQTLQEALSNMIYARMDFFEQLRVIAAQTSLGVELNADDTLADQEFLPRWVDALPYRSRVLGMSPSMFANLSQSQQVQFERTLEAKVAALEEITANTDVWIELEEGDPESLNITALPLALLP